MILFVDLSGRRKHINRTNLYSANIAFYCAYEIKNYSFLCVFVALWQKHSFLCGRTITLNDIPPAKDRVSGPSLAAPG